MRNAFWLIPAAVIAASPATADDYLTVKQAQELIFPGAKLTPADFSLTEDQIDQLVKASNSAAFRSRVKAWKVSTGGWFFLDQVFGRDDIVTYAVGVDSAGAVVGIEVLVCASGWCGVRSEKWLAQFSGKRAADTLTSDTISNSRFVAPTGG
jgi:hypothetical protein